VPEAIAISDPILAAAGVRKSYRDGLRDVMVLHDVDFAAAAGEMVAIVGPSGAGKSTLLHLLGLLDTADAGTIRVAGQEARQLDRTAAAALRNRSIGFVFQFHRLLPDFSALENVLLPGRIAGMAPAAARGRAAQLLEEVGLAARADFFPNQLSGGERQRVAICRALMMAPPILLADEPTGNLDPESAEQVFQMLLDVQRRHGTTTVLVTHNPALADRCARILELRGGALAPLGVQAENDR
jgi:lipoprotein-releasing system ATP-binding protein